MSEPVRVVDNTIEIDYVKMETGKAYYIEYDGSKYRYRKLPGGFIEWAEIG